MVTAPRISVDIVGDHVVLREGLSFWLDASASRVEIVDKFAGRRWRPCSTGCRKWSFCHDLASRPCSILPR